jgi:uncharacterized membrane protein
MTAHSKSEAQQRADDIKAFHTELARLEAERVLTLSDAQRVKVQGHHDALLAEWARSFDIDRDGRGKQLSLGMRIASFFGALALAASVFFLFRRYWGLFPSSLKVVLLIGASLGSLAVTYLIDRRDASGYFAKLAATVAFACFVLNVSLLGSMFNITPSDSALIVWAAFALVLAYTLDLRLLLGAGLLCAIAYIAARVGTWSGVYWIYFGQRPENFFPAALLMMLVPRCVPHDRFAGFAALYRVFGLLAVLLPMLVLANWGRVSYLPFADLTIERFYQIMGFVVSAAAVWFGVRGGRREVINTGVTFFVIFLYTKFYDWWWDRVPKFVFFLIIALTSILFLLVLRRLRATSSGVRS